jgi:hypothetical protein
MSNDNPQPGDLLASVLDRSSRITTAPEQERRFPVGPDGQVTPEEVASKGSLSDGIAGAVGERSLLEMPAVSCGGSRPSLDSCRPSVDDRPPSAFLLVWALS